MYFKGTVNGLEVDCDETKSFICFKADWFSTPEKIWYFQGDEASEVIECIQNIVNIHQGEIGDLAAAAHWANHYLY